MVGLSLAGYTDELLVLAAIAGDFASFDELVRRYRAAVLRTVLRITPSQERAEDVVQEALVLAFQALPQLSTPQAFGSWLRTIAVRHARRRSKQERARTDAMDPLSDVTLAMCPALTDSPEDDVIGTADRRRVRDAIATLPHPYGEVLDLRFFHDMPLARIAAYQGVTVDGVKWRLRRALKLLRASLEEDGEDEAA